MKSKKIRSLAALFLALGMTALCACAGGQDAPAEEAQTPAPVHDSTGRYILTDAGEAVIDDACTRAPAAAEDNARVFYEIFVGSFSDSDGDGIGDLRGIIDRMDYLNDGDPSSGLSLGVEGLWLTPVFSSGSYHKYDVNDYYEIDPDFGDMDDLRSLAALCHERGVKLILDLPINHTGPLNPWFSAFKAAHRSGDTDDPYYDFYVYYTEGETAPAGRTFAPIAGTEDYYECNFSPDMPELDFDNPAVREAVVDVAKYYLALGVDGFRFDAAKYIYFGDDAKCVDFWTWYMDELRSIDPDVYTVAEVWASDGVTDLYYPALNCFDFTVSQADGLIASTAKKGDVNTLTAYVEKYIDSVTEMRGGAMLVPFIANHDTDRAAGYLTAASGQMQMAANLYILGPGSPFIYYGEELGLRGSRGSASTDANRRLAMPWGDGDTVRDPEGATYPADKQLEYTAADELGNGDSLLSYYKRLLMIRNANPEIARGEYRALRFSGTKLGGFISTLDGSSVAVIHNTTSSSITVDLADVTDLAFDGITAVIGLEDASLDGTVLTLGSCTSAVLK